MTAKEFATKYHGHRIIWRPQFKWSHNEGIIVCYSAGHDAVGIRLDTYPYYRDRVNSPDYHNANVEELMLVHNESKTPLPLPD